ncbi:hypothetical protein C3L33_03235, partial [Rhododendron williamsianum]
MDAGNNDTHTHVLDFNGFCNLCNKPMRSKKAVVEHQNIVHQGAKIKCTVCGRSFIPLKNVFFKSRLGMVPINLLYSIAVKIVKFSDYKHFSAVCQRWRHHALELATDDYKQRLHILKTCHNKLPMLMIDTKENRESDERCLFSVTEGITYRVQLPLPCNKRLISWILLWMVIYCGGQTMVIILLNPFTGGAIPLPPLKDPHGPYEDFIDDDPENFVKKVVLSSDPFLSPNNYEVVVIYEGMHRLAILESGKDSWNFVDRAPFVYSDVIYYPEGQGRGLYAVNYWRELVKIDLGSSTKKVLTKRTAYNAASQVTYLVQSQEGDLLLVERFWVKPDCEIWWKTWRFMVFKLLHSIGETEAATWVPIKSLGSQPYFWATIILFVFRH